MRIIDAPEELNVTYVYFLLLRFEDKYYYFCLAKVVRTNNIF